MPTPEDKAREHIDEALAKAREKTPDHFSRSSDSEAGSRQRNDSRPLSVVPEFIEGRVEGMSQPSPRTRTFPFPPRSPLISSPIQRIQLG